MAISDVGTKLYAKLGGALKYAKLVSITAVPATGSAGGKLEYTELDSTLKQYIPDRVDIPELDFTFNYTEANKHLVDHACTGTSELFLIKYSDGSGVKITGIAQNWVNGLGRGAIAEGTLHIVASAIEYVGATTVTGLIDDNASI